MVDLDVPVVIKDEEILKHMKHLYEIDLVHNYFKNRATGSTVISSIKQKSYDEK